MMDQTTFYFDDAYAAPLSNFDLLAIAPFVILAVAVAGIRKFRKRRRAWSEEEVEYDGQDY